MSARPRPGGARKAPLALMGFALLALLMLLSSCSLSSSSSALAAAASPSSAAPLPSSPRAWSVAEVQRWLAEEVGLSDYAADFAREAIDGEALLELTGEELQGELGVAKLGHRKRLEKEIAQLQRRAPPTAPSSSPSSPPSPPPPPPPPPPRPSPSAPSRFPPKSAPSRPSGGAPAGAAQFEAAAAAAAAKKSSRGGGGGAKAAALKGKSKGGAKAKAQRSGAAHPLAQPSKRPPLHRPPAPISCPLSTLAALLRRRATIRPHLSPLSTFSAAVPARLCAPD